MKKYFLIIGLLMYCWTPDVLADIVHLKDGQSVRGEVFSDTKYSVKIKTGKIFRTFYRDEVKRVVYDEDLKKGIEMLRGAPEEISEEKKNLVKRLMQANGAIDGIRAALRVALGEFPPMKRKIFEKHLKGEVLVEKMIPVYARHFSEEELKELIRFYNSPIGRKNLEVAPDILEESMAVALDYFTSLDKEVAAE